MAKSGILVYPAFVRLWMADTVSWLGAFTIGLALQFLLIETMDADQGALGVVRAAQWLPALLSVPLVAVLVFLVGTASVFFSASHQAYVPRLVPTRMLPIANARTEQTMTAAESVGPLVAGAIVRVLSAPMAVLMSAFAHAASAVVLCTIRFEEPAPRPNPDRYLWRELKEGAQWVYRHRTLAPYAIALHVWFFFNSAIMTIFVFFAAEELGLDSLMVGLLLAGAGMTGVVGAGLAPGGGAVRPSMGSVWGSRDRSRRAIATPSRRIGCAHV